MPTIKWYKSKFDDEKDEFLRIEKELGIPYKAMRDRYAVTRSPVFLTNTWWSILGNTDSWKVKSFSHIAKLLTAYKKPIENLGFLLDDILLRSKCGLPIVIAYVDKKGNQKLTLVSGNTRLALCKVMSIQPRVILLEFIGED